MPLRAPPGRAGRAWLAERLAAARRAAGLLDRKRQALLAERAGLAPAAAEARRVWIAAAAEASRWLDRAVIAGDGLQVELVAAHVDGRATIDVAWTRAAGVRRPVAATLSRPPRPPASALGGSSSLELAVTAHAAALEAAVRHAVAQAGLRRVEAELAGTSRRLQALRRRWIPEHEAALADRELALAEQEREGALRVRWARERTEGAG